MDGSELEQLLVSGSQTLVTTMLTDLWTAAKKGFAALLGRRSHRSEAVASELEDARARLVADQGSQAEVAAEWRGRLRQALSDDPALADELRALLDDLAPTRGETAHQAIGMVRQQAQAHDHAVVFQQGQGVQVHRTDGAQA